MKLLFCKECHDMVALTYDERTCLCEKSKGRYDPNGIVVRYSGPAAIVGIANDSFLDAVRCQPTKAGPGRDFRAFVIPLECGATIFEEV